MNGVGAISWPFQIDGHGYVLMGREDAAGLHFWIEHPRGRVWMPVNEPLPAGHGMAVDVFHEIVALTFDDPAEIMAHIAAQSGWFEPTGRTVQYPRHQQNEVWHLTPHCLAKLRSPSAAASVRRLLDQAGADLDAAAARVPPSCLDGVARALLGRLNGHGYSALMMTRPSVPALPGDASRVVEVATALPVIHQSVPFLNAMAHAERCVYAIDIAPPCGPWSDILEEMGFRSALVVRMPVLANECYDFYLFSTGWSLEAGRQSGAAMEVMRAWPHWRDIIQRELCPLNASERVALKAMALGLSSAQARRGWDGAERDLRVHADNARRKLHAVNSAQAVHRARLLCAF